MQWPEQPSYDGSASTSSIPQQRSAWLFLIKIERTECHLSHICEPPQLRSDSGTLSSLIGDIRSLTQELQNATKISVITHHQVGTPRPSHWFIKNKGKGPVHLAYNPFYSTCFFSAGTIFFSHKKSANSVFQPAYNSSRTGPKLARWIEIMHSCLVHVYTFLVVSVQKIVPTYNKARFARLYTYT
jgi:hypothetical protein